MQHNIKKEVSCKTLIPIINAFNEKKIDLGELIEGIPYDLNYLLNKHERIEWWVYCKIISNSRKYFDALDFEEMGRKYVKNGSYIEGVLGALFLFSSNKFLRILEKHFFRIAENSFKCIKHTTEYLDLSTLKVTAFLNEDYEFCPEVFLISKGVWEQFGTQIGHKEFNIEVNWIYRGVIFRVSWKKESILFKLKSWFNWLFSFRKVFLELTDSHEELQNQYYKLEESKRLLQRQTKQLRTAYEISTSIRQSLKINDTLKAIAESLVNESDLSSVIIEVEKDLEGNMINRRFQTGSICNSIKPIRNELVINNNNIGSLISYPHLETDYDEISELIDYLLPIINIAIHDALVLKEITHYKDNLENKVKERTNELEKAQQYKDIFFTNISHEFRTPLTLIMGPVKKTIENLDNVKMKDDLAVAYKNANKLLGLVNQLLDISKVESGNIKLQAVVQNIVPFLKNIVLSFSAYAERKNITLKFHSPEVMVVYIDDEKIEKVITNIIFNAIKFTPMGGRIKLKVKKKDSNVVIAISDSGIGIPKEKLPKIFDRFYQVDGSHKREHEGTGIGLALAKALVEMHKGTINVESEEGRGTTFIIKIPVGKDHLKPEEICDDLGEKVIDKEIRKEYLRPENFVDNLKDSEEQKMEIELCEKNSLPMLLMVEDNVDVRNYIKSNLETEYKILESVNGEDGWNITLSQIPELIISDVMMPKMDGFELCKKIKTDERTSHIPIILLTAKATMQDKLNGLGIGADEYIMKPFDIDEVKVRIRNLLEQRKRIHEHFKNKGLIKFDETKITSLDKKFLQKTFDMIIKNMSDVSFNVEQLARKLCMSRSILHKKIFSLTGEPPVELIKRIRLTKAAELIQNKAGNISEISLEVGFNNPAYFSECFKKQFRITPKEYSQQFINS